MIGAVREEGQPPFSRECSENGDCPCQRHRSTTDCSSPSPFTTMVWTPPGLRCDMIVASADPHQHNQEETEMDATTVAVDLAKSVFELAIADVQWRITARQRLNRTQFARFLRQTAPTHVVMEAC